MGKQISIIIPIYNGEKYLARCVDSVLNQTFGIERIKVLLLIDGAIDGSLKIAKSYEERFPGSIKVYSHKNMGVAKTRNKGVALVNAKYLMFIDQDDFIDNDYCEKFYEAAEATSADVVAGGFRRTDSHKVFYERHANNTKWYPFIHAEAWAKIHRTDFVKKSGAEFFDNIFGEDILFSLQETLSMKNFQTIDYVGYNWFTNESSVTRTIHKDFSKLNLPKLLTRLSKMNNSELIEYYIFVVALYAFMVSNVRVGFGEFRKNLDAVFDSVNKLLPNLQNNTNLRHRVDGCPTRTYLATKIFMSFYSRGWYRLLFIINRIHHRKIVKK